MNRTLIQIINYLTLQKKSQHIIIIFNVVKIYFTFFPFQN